MSPLTNAPILELAARKFSDPATRAHYFDLYDADAVLHGYPGVEPGIDSIRQFYASFWAAFPDAQLQIEDIVEQGQKLAARFVVRATHRGEFMAIPPTGRSVTLTGITVLSFRQGRCIERWSEANFLALLQQIGAMPG